jgi:hypothetical protein
MKQVEWLSPERIIPANGVATPGQLISLPDDLADKFIEQGEPRVPVIPKKSIKEIQS